MVRFFFNCEFVSAVIMDANVFDRLSVLLSDKYSDFIEANRIEDADNRLKTMNKLVRVRG